ncbi:hypothetical protein [Caldovatus aquaticus]|uniref:DUF4124 domain-containing protein n=1 Tax=Caldovatus aquaticus TaxID=2865671 RepID=A0ABS7F6G3_9PROT|nr:hypothetical protein [Caldovatus aquaticus]MBW8271216.1 hypothetical protein [Caldovatus aquaticus]
MRDAFPPSPRPASPRRGSARPGLALFLAALVLAPPAGAQGLRYQFGIPGTGLPEKGEYGPGILTAEQAEACLRRWQALGAAQDALEHDRQQLDRMEAELNAPPRRAQPAARRGGQQGPAQPPPSAEQVAAEHRAKIEAADAQRRRYMAGVERHHAQLQAFNFDCATKRFYEEDMRAARARLGIAD